jgi:hypothetical protein
MESGPRIENFDVFEENVRLGINEPQESIQHLEPDTPSGFEKNLAQYSPEIQEQIIKATNVLKRSAFPPRQRFPMVDSSASGTQHINGLNSSLNNGVDPSLYGNVFSRNPLLHPATPSRFAGMMGGSQMQSPIIYEKKSLREFVAEKFKRMIK